jgi:hypothetical protein
MFRSSLTAITPVGIQSIPFRRVAACCLRTSRHTCELVALGLCCSSYAKLMRYRGKLLGNKALGEEVLPEGVMLKVRYEDVVDGIQGQARQLIAHGVVHRVLQSTRP